MCFQDILKSVLSYTQNCSSLFVVLSLQEDCELLKVGLASHTIRAEKTYLHSLITIINSSCQESNLSSGLERTPWKFLFIRFQLIKIKRS